MEPNSSFSLLSFLKNTTTLFKFIELSNKGVNAEKNFAARYKNEQQFDQFFNELDFEFDKENIYSSFQFDADDVQLATRLPYALAFRYLLDEEFNSIRMQADHQNNYGALSMNDYFITPSYIPEEDLRKRETLMQAEKETSNTKIERMKAKFFQNFLPHEYISGSLFDGIDRVVITGNPGVGKSTYSRWLCYNWAKQQLNIKGILLHINLRLLQFGKENSLVQYIAKTYLKGADTKRLQKILSTINQDFYFVLDGFDELDDAGQKALKNDLYQLGSNVKFILLSRPYGLLNSQGLNWDFSFQIDGFNNSNIYNYVDKFLSLNGRQVMRDKLLDIISQNRVLEDYAHNPLMLSYITYLFLEDDEPEKRLLQVQSQYDLQDLVFSWIRSHEEVKKPKKELDKLMAEAAEFAYQMEINKKPILTNKETLDRDAIIAEYLNFIGLGKMQSLGQRHWQFSFNTLTFQEFLAARHLAERITPEAFLYLCKEKYFWNFTRMLIGCLSQKGLEDKVETILQAHLNQFEKNNQAFHWYFYIMHLSEASPAFLQKKMQGDAIGNMYFSYRLAFWDNPTWRPILLDAIARIYSKLSLPNKLHLQKLLYIEFDKMLTPNSQGTSTPNVEHAKALILKLRLENDLSFLKKVMALQERTMENLWSPAYPTYLDEAHEGLMFLFDEVLCKAHPEKLRIYLDDLRRLLDRTIPVFIIPKAKLQLHFTELEGLPEKVYEDCITLEKFVHLHKNDTEKMELEGQVHMQDLAMSIYHLGNLAKTSDDETKKLILPTMVRCARLLLEAIDYAEMDDYDQDELGQLLIEGMVQINMPELYDWILESALVIQPSYMVVRIPDNDAFFVYLQSLIEKNEADLDEIAMEKLIMSLNIIENARNQFARIREGFADVLTDYVKANNLAFEQSAGGYVQHQSGTPEADNYEITRKFNSIIDSALTDSEVFAYDKKYLMDRLTTFHEYRYFRSYFHPSIWGRDFNLYQSEYWELVLDYIKNKADFPALMTVLRNPNIYRYSSNLLPLSKILSYFLSLSQSDIPGNFPVRLVEILSRILALIKITEGNQIPIDKDQVLQLVILLAEKYDLKTAFLDISPREIEGNDLLLFILLYHYTQDNHYVLNLDYDTWMTEYPKERMSLMNQLLIVFTKNEQLNLKDLQQLYPLLGEKFVHRLEKLLKLRTELTERFIPEELDDLLSKVQ